MVDGKSKIESPSRSSEAPTASEKTQTIETVDLSGDSKASDLIESVDGDEEGAEAMGHVSENIKEGIGENRQTTAGKFQQFSKQLTDEEAEELKNKLLKSPPTKRQMVQEIRLSVNQEIRQLQKRAIKLERKGKFKELSEAVRRMRELRDILTQLFHATAEAVKNTWLKVVHGIV